MKVKKSSDRKEIKKIFMTHVKDYNSAFQRVSCMNADAVADIVDHAQVQAHLDNVRARLAEVL